MRKENIILTFFSQILSAHGNRLHALPAELDHISDLAVINVTANLIRNLPVKFLFTTFTIGFKQKIKKNPRHFLHGNNPRINLAAFLLPGIIFTYHPDPVAHWPIVLFYFCIKGLKGPVKALSVSKKGRQHDPSFNPLWKSAGYFFYLIPALLHVSWRTTKIWYKFFNLAVATHEIPDFTATSCSDFVFRYPSPSWPSCQRFGWVRTSTSPWFNWAKTQTLKRGRGCLRTSCCPNTTTTHCQIRTLLTLMDQR